MNLNPISKVLIGGGIVMVLLGLLFQFGSYFAPLGKLPGDIYIEKENVRFYFPIVTSLLLSVVLSLILYLFRHFK